METPQFSLRYLFMVTSSVAIGSAMLGSPVACLQAIGLGILLFWLAKTFFLASMRLPTVLRELVFLAGLPAYVGAVVCIVFGLVRCFGVLTGSTPLINN